MYDKPLILEVLDRIYSATQTILERFRPVKSVSDFTGSAAGMEKLDSICMQLIAIGEALKNLDKITNGALLVQYPQIDWKKAKGMRDIISHHYFDVDAEVIYHVCRNYIDDMGQAVKAMIKDLA